MISASSPPPANASQEVRPTYVGILTVRKAWDVLKPPLRFADDDQVRAHQLLQMLEEAKALVMPIRNGWISYPCPVCEGTGRHFGRTCSECAGIATRFGNVYELDKETLEAILGELRR